ncbi:MAG: hypothetical protein QM811_05220 [Pirellulales bacterium]
MHAHMQSQQACSISQHFLSPVVQVMQTPSSVIVQTQWHIIMLHWHMTMPFIMQQQLHMPSHIILHMFCNVAQAISSSHEQIIFMPPAHFSIFMVQRGIIVMFAIFGVMDVSPIVMPVDGVPIGIVPIDIIGRSIMRVIISPVSFRQVVENTVADAANGLENQRGRRPGGHSAESNDVNLLDASRYSGERFTNTVTGTPNFSQVFSQQEIGCLVGCRHN